ncbi:chemotaxis protein CheB [Saccharothrix syringae]|uniref:chemotaxis protein CheB n=1 Tax=Saccharothrix syringae TaxID=103733 RepID=UPI00068C21F1|nr:chemotaxis protein CheB [Saccharothrix syringae]
MVERDVVVIGASAGGGDALRRLVAGLPAGLPASVLIVSHTSPDSPRRLPDILARHGRLPAAYAVPGQRLTAGLLTVAPAGRHLVVTDGDVLRLHRGPLVHHTRPAIDPLLRSAAHACGPRVVAVVLSGLLRDGAEGAAAVAGAGGTVLVQDPDDARHPSMPRATLDRVPGATTWPADKLGSVIGDLVARRSVPGAPGAGEPCAMGVDEALSLAVAQLRAHAVVRERIQRRLTGPGPLRARNRDRAARAERAAELITSHVLPVFRPDGPA